MSSVPRPTVLIDIVDEALADRVARVLVKSSFVAINPAEVLPNSRFDLVVSTQPDVLARLGLATGGSAGVGLIQIAADDPTADACLETDFTDRELVLACRLAAQIVLWRRKALHMAETGRELERLAHTDPLTQVANRRAWDVELPRRLQAAAAAGQAVALAVFDVDHFKQVNDELGHATGDAVLTAIGKGLADSLRATDFVARLGGDEFGLLLVGAFDAASALRIVDRVRQHAMHGLTATATPPVMLSAGCVAAPPGTSVDPVQLFAAADAALRQAKQAGRDRTSMQPR